MRRQASVLTSLGLVLGSGLAVGLPACSEDAGPGRVRVRFESPVVAVGAVVVEVAGRGSGGAVGDPGTEVVVGDAGPSSRRVLATSLTDAPPTFVLDVDDIAAGLPTVTLIQAVDTQNRPLVASAQIEVRLERVP